LNAFIRIVTNITRRRNKEFIYTGIEIEKLFFKKMEVCCPFPSKNSEMGGGFLDIYEVTWVGQKSPIKLYLNIYEKCELMVPIGFELAK
jgi:hypothetical protein